MARPKFRILLYCQNEVKLSIMRFVLHNCSFRPGYKVTGVSSKCDYLKAISAHSLNFYDGMMFVHSHPCDAAVSLCGEVTKCGVRTVFLTDGGMADAWMKVHATCSYPKTITVADALERLRVICIRKRGPKKALTAKILIEEMVA
jgi:hypothetical protein